VSNLELAGGHFYNLLAFNPDNVEGIDLIQWLCH